MSLSEREMSKQEEAQESAGTAECIDEVPTTADGNRHGLTSQVVLVYIALQLTAFAAMMTVVASGLVGSYMAADIGGASETMWLPQSNTIVTLALTIPVAQVADYWGRKWPLIFACVAACAGSIIISRASTMATALAGNVVASFSVAAMPLLFAVASEIVPRRYRAVSQGGINAMLAVAGVVVLLAGTRLCQDYHEGWRILWYVCAAAAALATALTFFLYNPPPRELQVSLTQRQKLARLDWVGICLIPVGLTLVTVGLTWSQNPYPWPDAHIMAPFIIGAVVLVFVIVYEAKIKQDGLFHHGLFSKGYNFPLVLYGIFVEGATFFTANTFFPMEIGILFETSPFKVGLRFAVTFFAATASAMIVAWYSSWQKVVRTPLVAGFTCFTIACAAIISIDIGSSATAWASAVFLGLGMGMVLTPLTTAAQFSAPPELITISTGALLCLRTFGAAIMLPIDNAVLNSQLSKYMPMKIAEQVLPAGLAPEHLDPFIGALNAHDDHALASIPGVTPEIIGAGLHGLQKAYVSSFRILWVLPLALSVTAAIACYFLVDPKSEFSMQVDAPVERD